MEQGGTSQEPHGEPHLKPVQEWKRDVPLEPHKEPHLKPAQEWNRDAPLELDDLSSPPQITARKIIEKKQWSIEKEWPSRKGLCTGGPVQS